MYRQSFGSIGQVQFTNEHEYYRLLGYLAKSDGSTELAWEHNEDQGAWGSEGRIKFRSPKPNNIGTLKLTAGVGNVLYRVNCNSFIIQGCPISIWYHFTMLGVFRNYSVFVYGSDCCL